MSNLCRPSTDSGRSGAGLADGVESKDFIDWFSSSKTKPAHDVDDFVGQVVIGEKTKASIAVLSGGRGGWPQFQQDGKYRRTGCVIHEEHLIMDGGSQAEARAARSGIFRIGEIPAADEISRSFARRVVLTSRRW